MAPARSCPPNARAKKADRQAARRAGDRRRRRRAAARARGDRRRDPAAVRGGAGWADARQEDIVADAFVIETTDLRKHYDGVEAVRGLNLQVPAGSICGFLGRNGAGKTTTIKMLLGMARPTSGHARVFGLAGRHAGGERGDPPPHRLCQRRQRSLRLHDGGGDDPLHRRLLSALARRPRAALPPHVRPAARPEGQGAVARDADQARVAARALPRRRAAHPRRADLGARPRR